MELGGMKVVTSYVLRYTPLQSYRLIAEHFTLPSLSFLRKISEGSIDTVKGLKALKAKGKISSDVILIFDEMYLARSILVEKQSEQTRRISCTRG